MKLIYQQPSGWADTQRRSEERCREIGREGKRGGERADKGALIMKPSSVSWLSFLAGSSLFLRPLYKGVAGLGRVSVRRTFIKPSNCLRQIWQVKWISAVSLKHLELKSMTARDECGSKSISCMNCEMQIDGEGV